MRVVQALLQRHQAWLWPLPTPRESGQFDTPTADAISKFQVTAAARKTC